MAEIKDHFFVLFSEFNSHTKKWPLCSLTHVPSLKYRQYGCILRWWTKYLLASSFPQQILRNDRKDILAGTRKEKEKEKERTGKRKKKNKAEEEKEGGEDGGRRGEVG